MRELSVLSKLEERSTTMLIVLYTLCCIIGGIFYYNLYAGYITGVKIQRVEGQMAAAMTSGMPFFEKYYQDKSNSAVLQSIQSMFNSILPQFAGGDLALVDDNMHTIISGGYMGENAARDIPVKLSGVIFKDQSPFSFTSDDNMVFVNHIAVGENEIALLYVTKKDTVSDIAFDSGITASIILFFIFYIIGLVIIAAGFGVLLSPLNAISRGIDKVVTGNFHFRLPVTSMDEVGMLSQSYNRLADKLKEFAGKADKALGMQHDTESELQQYRDHLERMIMQRSNSQNAEKDAINANISEQIGYIDRYNGILLDGITNTAAAFITAGHIKRYGVSLYDASDIAHGVVKKFNAKNLTESDLDTAVEKATAVIGKLMGMENAVSFMIDDSYEVSSFNINDLCGKITDLLASATVTDGMHFVAEADSESESSFSGYESYYLRMMMIIFYVVKTVLMRKSTEYPSVLVKIGVIGKSLRVVIQDNSQIQEEVIFTSREQSVIDTFKRDLEQRNNGSLTVRAVQRGLRYTIEFSGVRV